MSNITETLRFFLVEDKHSRRRANYLLPFFFFCTAFAAAAEPVDAF